MTYRRRSKDFRYRGMLIRFSNYSRSLGIPWRQRTDKHRGKCFHGRLATLMGEEGLQQCTAEIEHAFGFGPPPKPVSILDDVKPFLDFVEQLRDATKGTCGLVGDYDIDTAFGDRGWVFIYIPRTPPGRPSHEDAVLAAIEPVLKIHPVTATDSVVTLSIGWRREPVCWDDRFSWDDRVASRRTPSGRDADDRDRYGYGFARSRGGDDEEEERRQFSIYGADRNAEPEEPEDGAWADYDEEDDRFDWEMDSYEDLMWFLEYRTLLDLRGTKPT